MRLISVLPAFLLLEGAVSAVGKKSTAPGQLAQNPSQFGASSVLASTGTPTGEEFVYNNITFYIARPQGSPNARNKPAILYLSDVFGLALNQNKLLVDSFARAGYLTLAPDLFSGEPAPEDIINPSSGFNVTDFILKHGVAQTDPIIETAVAYLKNELKVSKIGTTGYCFGGKYAFRFAAAGRGANTAFTAHPSLVADDEILGIAAPVSVAAADNDGTLNATLRANMEALLATTGQRYAVNLYGGTPHGFAVRANLSIPSEKWGKEEAFVQAVRWFDTFLN